MNSEKKKTLIYGLGFLLVIAIFFSVIVHINTNDNYVYAYIETEESDYYKITKKFDAKGSESKLVIDYKEITEDGTEKDYVLLILDCVGYKKEYFETYDDNEELIEYIVYRYFFITNNNSYQVSYNTLTDEYYIQESYF